LLQIPAEKIFEDSQIFSADLKSDEQIDAGR